jgi:uncharacterized protein YbaP (TraB family)
MKNLLLAMTAVAAMLICSCSKADAPANPPPRPLLWKVSDADNAIYLLGSFHLLKPSDYPLAESTDAAFEDAEHVVFELSPADLASPDLAQAMAGAALRGGGLTLQQALPAKTWKRLSAYFVERRIDPVAMQQYDAWFVSLLVAITEMQAAGLQTDHGLDKHFADRSIAAGKPSRGLETIDQQIALFEGMSREQQVQSLESTLEDIADIRGAIDEMHRLWRDGDEAGLFAATGAEMQAEFPALYQRMNVDRNRAWLPELRAMLDGSDGDDTLVIVGAMHLLGEDGVVEGLREAGFRVERL